MNTESRWTFCTHPFMSASSGSHIRSGRSTMSEMLSNSPGAQTSRSSCQSQMMRPVIVSTCTRSSCNHNKRASWRHIAHHDVTRQITPKLTHAAISCSVSSNQLSGWCSFLLKDVNASMNIHFIKSCLENARNLNNYHAIGSVRIFCVHCPQYFSTSSDTRLVRRVSLITASLHSRSVPCFLRESRLSFDGFRFSLNRLWQQANVVGYGGATVAVSLLHWSQRE